MRYSFFLSLFVIIAGCSDPNISPTSVSPTTNLHKEQSPDLRVVYFEDFSDSSTGWKKVTGPGLLEVVDGVFKHTTYGFSVWCDYVYPKRVFGNGRYEVTVFVESLAVNTAFEWRNPDTLSITGDGGAYQARFNNSDIAPGGAGHFVLEKFDPLGRTILLEIPEAFFGLNRLVIDDSGTEPDSFHQWRQLWDN